MYKVYLLDDEPYILEGLKYILDWESFGFEIAGFSNNGEEGLNEILQNDIDLVITDIMMPKMTGLELIESLKKNNYKSNYIVLSAFQEFKYVKKAMSMGAENYITKPIDTEELSNTLKLVYEKIKQKEKEQNNKKVLNNSLILSLIKDKNTEEIDFILNELNLKKESKYRIAIVELKDKTKKIKDILPKVLNNKDIVYCIDNINTALFILNDSSYIDYLTDLKNNISNLTEDIVYISIGKEVLDFNDLDISYKTAKSISEYKIVYPKISWIKEYKDILDDNKNFYIDFELIKSMIKNKEFDNLYLEIEKLFEVLKENTHLNAKQIRLKAIEIFINIYNYINELKLIKNLSIYLENGIYKESIDDIEFEILNMIKFMENKLENAQESISPIILKLLQNIEKNYDKELNLKEISYELKVNSIYLGQLFQKETGSLFSDYINNYRINKAKELLINTSLKANEVGELVGYSNKNYFYRKFKNIVGVTPSEWRKINL